MANKKKTKTTEKKPVLTAEQWRGLHLNHELVGYVFDELILRAKGGNRTAISILKTAEMKFKAAKQFQYYRKMMNG